MKICLVGIEYPKETGFGGISTYQYLLANELKKLNHEVIVICGTDKEDYSYNENGIEIYRIHTNRVKETVDSFRMYREKVADVLNKLIDDNRIDIIETPEFSGEIVNYLKSRRVPVVTKLHTSYTIWAHLNKTKLPTKLHKEVLKTEELVLKYSDKIVSCSQILKDIMPEYHKLNNYSDISVLENPANIRDFYPTKNNHNSNTIIFCGSIEKRKGINELASAIPIVIEKINDESMKFQIVGNYSVVHKNGIDAKQHFLNLIPEKYHKYIEFTGPIPNEKLNEYFNNARIGVIPSLFDNLPYVAMEELLTELPIVASSNTGIREMIKNNESGILYSPEDYNALAEGVIKLYLNQKLAREMGRKGREEILRKYSPNIIAKKNIKIYEETIEKYKNEKQKMHVCLVNFEYPNETVIGGIATYQKRIADALHRNNCRVTVICGSWNSNKDYYEDGIHIVRVQKNFPYKNLDDYYSYRKKISDIIKEIDAFDKIDVIESPELSAEMITFMKNKTIPVVTKLHTSYTFIKMFNNETSMFPDEVEKVIYRNENFVINNSDAVVSCSQILKELMPKYHKINDYNEIIVSGNPANTKDFYPTKNNHNSNTIIFCGKVIERKGVFILARALPLIIDKLKDENIRFQIVGDYESVEQQNVSAKEIFLNLIPEKYHKYIEFTGPIPNEKLNEYFNNARIGVIPSLFDNLPYVAMEELLTELPIVASSNTGIREMIKNNESGILYSPEDYNALAEGVIKLYLNQKLAREMGKKGREEILRKYSPDIIAKKNIKIYKNAIKNYNETKEIKSINTKLGLKKIIKVNNGQANRVVKGQYNNKKVIIKYYHKLKMYNYDLIKEILSKNIHCNKLINLYKFDIFSVGIYNYIDGRIKKNFSIRELEEIFNECDKIHKIDIKNNIYKNIFDKINLYYEALKNIDDPVIKNIVKKYAQLSTLSNSTMTIIHGDLVYTNIIWNQHVNFIDFDECIIAPQEYELSCFLIKNCFENGKFNVNKARKIVRFYKKRGYSIEYVKNNYYLYIVKVLLEKLYYNRIHSLDLESPEQKKDYWRWWYLLLNDELLENNIFNI